MERIQEVESKMDRFSTNWYKDTAECITDIKYLLAENKRLTGIIQELIEVVPGNHIVGAYKTKLQQDISCNLNR